MLRIYDRVVEFYLGILISVYAPLLARFPSRKKRNVYSGPYRSSTVQVGSLKRPSIHWTIAVGMAHTLTVASIFLAAHLSFLLFEFAYTSIVERFEYHSASEQARREAREEQCSNFCEANGLVIFSTRERRSDLHIFECACVQTDRHLRHDFICPMTSGDTNNCYYD